MIIIVLAGVLGGIKLDEYLKWKFPVFTLLLSILSVFFAIYYAIKDFLKK
jgi:TctA family transporter